MAKHGIDLSFGELFNASFERLAADPTLSSEYAPGYVYFNTATNTFKGRTASGWVDFSAAGGGSGDILSNGSVDFTGPQRFADGSAAAPSICFANDPNVGFYSSGLDGLGVSIGGTKVAEFLNMSFFCDTIRGLAGNTPSFIDYLKTDQINEYTAAAGVSIDGAKIKDGHLIVGSGSVTDVAICKGSDIDTGIYFDALNTVSIAAGGVDALHMNGNNTSILTTFILALNEINLSGNTTATQNGSVKFNAGSDRFEMVTSGGDIILKVDGGWTLPSGTAIKTGFDADASTTASDAYVKAEVQAINDQLVLVAQTVKAMMDHLFTNMGLFAT